MFNLQIKFQELITKYEELNYPSNKQQFHEIIYNVYIDKGQKGDII